MKLHAVLTTLLALLAIQELARSADPLRGYDAFRFVRTRNIFDPNRQSMRPDAPRSESRPQSNYLALTGTMVTEGKALAFFSGTGADSSKVAGIGETVGSYKIKTIAPQQVELEKDGQAVTLPIGRQLTLEGTVTVRVSNDPSPPPQDSAPGSAPASTTPEASPPSGNKDDVLRRMMERRAKEFSK